MNAASEAAEKKPPGTSAPEAGSTAGSFGSSWGNILIFAGLRLGLFALLGIVFSVFLHPFWALLLGAATSIPASYLLLSGFRLKAVNGYLYLRDRMSAKKMARRHRSKPEPSSRRLFGGGEEDHLLDR